MNKILKLLFVITGGELYFKYILPTNPSSRNPINRWLCKRVGIDWSVSRKTAYQRLYSAYLLIILHGIMFILTKLLSTTNSTLINVLVNLYPVWVNVYIGYRCYSIEKTKKMLRLKRE